MVEQRGESLTVSLLEEAMRHVIAAVITTFALCTPAAGTMGDYPWPIFGAMLGGAVDCLVTRCTAQVPKGVWPGMFAGMAITAFAPRRVAGTFLGAGGSIVAGSLIGGAIEGDYVRTILARRVC